MSEQADPTQFTYNHEQEAPRGDEHDRTCMYYRSFGDWPCDCSAAEALTDHEALRDATDEMERQAAAARAANDHERGCLCPECQFGVAAGGPDR